MLTVNAVNSTLSSLLTAIRNKTGIEFEGAELAGQERVAISMGPASEGEVLASILSGSSLDYVVMGRPDSPTIVQRVLLTRRSRPGAQVAALNQRFRFHHRRLMRARSLRRIPDERDDHVRADRVVGTRFRPKRPFAGRKRHFRARCASDCAGRR